MASNFLPLLLAGGAIAVISSKKKKKKSSSSEYGEFVDVNIPPPPAPAPAPADSTASSAVWMQRQRALAYLGGMGFCKCSPGPIDGNFGTATKNAIKAFQKAVGLTADGKWGPNTDRIMGEALAKAAIGALKMPQPGKTWFDLYNS